MNASCMLSVDQERIAIPDPSEQDFLDAEAECKFNWKKGDPVKDVIQNWFKGCLRTI